MVAKHLKPEELRIEVRGPERASNAFICKVIADSFRQAGLAHLEVINQFGDSIDQTSTKDAYKLARIRNPLLDLAGIYICPEGPVMEVIEVFQNQDRMEDDEGNDIVVEEEFEYEEF